MRGSHHIIVESTSLKYEFDIRRNITVIRGDSATGKTTLVDLLAAYSVQGEAGGIRLNSDVPCVVYGADASSWQQILPRYHGSIVFIDEDYHFITSRDFADMISGTDNYYVLITRRDLVCLPYSVHEIYGIRTSGKYHFPQQIYHEFYRIYPENYGEKIHNALLVTEDKNAGYQFFSSAFGKEVCFSADGNAGIFDEVLKMQKDRPLVVIADGAAFGAFIEKVLEAVAIHGKGMVYLPESFEWLILRSGVVGTKTVADILAAPENYIESSQYFSWEQFFTDLLRKESGQNAFTLYQKSKLSQYYITGANKQKILSVMPKEILEAMKQG